MNTTLKQALTTNKTLKVMALLLGYSAWMILSSHQTITQWVQVPVCFYNVPSNLTIDCSVETMNIQVKGTAADIKACTDLALHCDASHFKGGEQKIYPTARELCLPTSVKLVHYQPLCMVVKCSIT